MKKIILLIGICASWVTHADPPTPTPGPSSTGTSINVDIKKNTDTVHVINTNNDGDVISKTYILKHADPYEIREVLRQAVGARRINNKMTGVECVKYNDGTGAVIVSAEAYRFKKQPNGAQSIDELVQMLDQPGAQANDDDTILYAPKNRSARDIRRNLHNVGLDHPRDRTELQRGKDRSFVDSELNVIMIEATPYNQKNIHNMNKVYDQSIPEIMLSYKVYEIYEERDEKTGMDYQSWKNGPGAKFFTAAARVSNRGTTTFVHFSPKWDMRYIDFLATKSLAKLVTSGSGILQNRKLYNNVAITSTDGQVDHSRATTGFNLRVIPSINTQVVTLDLSVAFISPIGTESDGSLRTSQTNYSTRVQIPTYGAKIVMGGLESAQSVKGEVGPGFWDKLMGNKTTSVKKTSLLVILSCVPANKKNSFPKKAKEDIEVIKKALKDL